MIPLADRQRPSSLVERVTVRLYSKPKHHKLTPSTSSRIMRLKTAQRFRVTRLNHSSIIFSSFQSVIYRALQTSSRSRTRAVEQFSNAELLNMIQKDNANTIDDLPTHVLDSRQSAPILPQKSRLIAQPLISARALLKGQKPHPSQKRSSFQLKLQRNPYGT